MIIFTFSVICINSIIWFKPYCKWKIWINKIEKKKMVVLFRIKNLIKRDSWNRVEERMHSFSSNTCISLYCYNKFQNKQTRVRVMVFNTTLYASWIYDYLCSQCLSPLALWVRIQLRQGVLDTTYVIKFVSDLR
jgi:hypothetical protein